MIPYELQARKCGGIVDRSHWETVGYFMIRPPPQNIDILSPMKPILSLPCPHLPEISEIHDFSLTCRHGHAKGADFYVDALRYAQSQWLSRKPAQAILQLNKAWMADLTGEEPILKTHPSPYRALVWIMETASSGDHGYMGNPVRHFQHLASRMSGPRAEIRAWRAWLCFHLAERTLPGIPRDGEQTAREGLWIPSGRRALLEVRAKGWRNECEGIHL